jgi:hypothetical protein
MVDSSVLIAGSKKGRIVADHYRFVDQAQIGLPQCPGPARRRAADPEHDAGGHGAADD